MEGPVSNVIGRFDALNGLVVASASSLVTALSNLWASTWPTVSWKNSKKKLGEALWDEITNCEGVQVA
jgi:hypothetical protein